VIDIGMRISEVLGGWMVPKISPTVRSTLGNNSNQDTSNNNNQNLLKPSDVPGSAGSFIPLLLQVESVT
ncbi:hypothetical protein V4Y02_23890, partial [Escherichia coli]